MPGPEICTFSYSVHRDLPAGTRCAFDVTIDYQVAGTIYFFESPPRAVAHSVAEGTAVGNGHTLIRTARFTESASPLIVFTDHGLLGRYSLPDGGTVTVFAATTATRCSRRSLTAMDLFSDQVRTRAEELDELGDERRVAEA